MHSTADLVIIGAGSGGLVAAELAAGIGVKVVLVEKHRLGGDCLWTGCVPSKSLLAAAKVAHHTRTASQWGISTGPVEIDLDAVWSRVRSVQERVAVADDDPDRYRSAGVDVVIGTGRLDGDHVVAVDLADGSGVRRIQTSHALITTGSRPSVPDIAGLDAVMAAGVPVLTSESLFEIDHPPTSLIVVGGGPIAVEMAQALSRLGVDVTVVQRGMRLLPKEEPSLVDVLTDRLRAEGVSIHLGSVPVSAEPTPLGLRLVAATPDGTRRFEAGGLLIATGRTPSTAGLGLETAGVVSTPKGISVDRFLRTSADWVWAAGDVAGRWAFTHAAGYEAARAVRTMFFPGRGAADAVIPWCTFTDPELAHVGMTETEARASGLPRIELHVVDLDRSDRARADGTESGRVRIVTSKGRIVGAHILAPTAGEMIHELAALMQLGGGIGELTKLVHAYPTYMSSVGQIGTESAFAKARRFRWAVRLSRARRAG